MGSASVHRCRSCGYETDYITLDFDYGMSAVVVTPVLCATHGVMTAETGLMAWDTDWESQKADEYPCPECGELSPRWNRRTCPQCGKKSMGIWRDSPVMMWD